MHSSCAHHLCFHSSMLGFTSQKVLPMFTVQSVSRSVPAIVGIESLNVVDQGGVSYAFAITSVDSGLAKRLHDLLQQVLGMFKADAVGKGQRCRNVNGDDERDEPDEMQILARIQRQARAKHLRDMRSTAPDPYIPSMARPPPSPSPSILPEPALPHTPCTLAPLPSPSTSSKGGSSNGGNNGGGEEGDGVRERAIVSEPEIAHSGAAAGGRDGGVGRVLEGDRRGGIGLREGRSTAPRSSMAMGIQAFLEQSQRKS
ncbi:unnamed protein product [Choristocarpus tenellus]